MLADMTVAAHDAAHVLPQPKRIEARDRTPIE